MRQAGRLPFVDWRLIDRVLHATERVLEAVCVVDFGTRTEWGSIRGRTYRPARRPAGFFSQLTSTLSDLVASDVAVDRIVANEAFEAYRVYPGRDVWKEFFSRPTRASVALSGAAPRQLATGIPSHHGDYSRINFSSLQPYLSTFFSPSTRVMRRQSEFLWSYGLEMNNLVAVNIRGTDKHKEIEPAPLDVWLQLTKRAIHLNPSAQLLLVSDQAQFIESFEKHFGDRVITLQELPTSRQTRSPIHRFLRRSERLQFGINFLAAVKIMSKAKVLITHTGNVAFWTVLFRASVAGVAQVRGEIVFDRIDEV